MVLDILDEKKKRKIIDTWKAMSDEDKGHFINQVALALSIWGSDKKGKEIVLQVLRLMSTNGSSTLADFGLYIEDVLSIEKLADMDDKIKRAAIIIEGYRIKNALPSEPHRTLV